MAHAENEVWKRPVQLPTHKLGVFKGNIDVHTGTESPTHTYEHFGDRQKLAMHIVRC